MLSSKWWNNKTSDIKTVYFYSTIKMEHGPINIRFTNGWKYSHPIPHSAVSFPGWLLFKCPLQHPILETLCLCFTLNVRNQFYYTQNRKQVCGSIIFSLHVFRKQGERFQTWLCNVKTDEIFGAFSLRSWIVNLKSRLYLSFKIYR